MRIEAPRGHLQPRPGEVRVSDVRAALGPAWLTAKEVVVSVLPPRGGLPSSSRLSFATKRSGRGEHIFLACPACGEPRAVLYADGAGALGCRGCVRHRTEHQRRCRTTEYAIMGGRELDRLLRLAGSPVGASAGAAASLASAAAQLRLKTVPLVQFATELAAAALTATEDLDARKEEGE